MFRGRVLTTPRRNHTGGQLGQEHHVSLPETNVSLYFMLVKQQGGGGGGGGGRGVLRFFGNVPLSLELATSLFIVLSL